MSKASSNSMLFDHKPSQNNEISIQYIIAYSTIYIIENSFHHDYGLEMLILEKWYPRNKYIKYEFTLEKISFVFCRNGIDTKNKQ